MNDSAVKAQIREIYQKGLDCPLYSAEQSGFEPMVKEDIKESYNEEIKIMEEERNAIEEWMFDIVMAFTNKEFERYQRLYADFEEYCETVEMFSLCYEFDNYLEGLK